MTGVDGDALAGVGGAIGGKVAAHLRQAMVQTRLQLAPHQAAVAQKILADFTNHVSDEIRGVMAPLWRAIADSSDASGWVRDLASRLGNERGQAWAWIGGTATGAALGAGLSDVLNNELAPIFGPIINANPRLGLDPGTAAAALARGVIDDHSGLYDLGRAGLDDDRKQAIIAMNRVVPGTTEIAMLYARGDINRAQAETLLRRAGFGREHMAGILSLARTHVSVQDGAAMANRSIVDMTELRELARLGGYDPDDAAKYFELAGEPPAPELLYAAYRREIIDVDRLRRGITQGPIRNEWFDVIEALQYQPMSTVDAADAVLQGHMSIGEGRRVAKWNGLLPEHFETLIDSAGLAPGVELASEALNRGLLTEEQFRTAFLESRLKNKYVDLYVALRYRIVPQETVRRLYREGAYTYDQALQRLGHAGFAPEDAVALLSIEDADATADERELTKAEILGLYADRAIDEPTAREWLAGLGFAEAAVAWQLALADLRRSRRHTEAVITRVRAGYVAGRLSYTEAASLMDRLRVPANQREELVSLWDLERLALTRGLTVAQIQTSIRRGLLSPEDGYAELVAQGYSERDAGILVDLTAPAPR